MEETKAINNETKAPEPAQQSQTMDFSIDAQADKENIIPPHQNFNTACLNASLEPTVTKPALKQIPNLLKSALGGPHRKSGKTSNQEIREQEAMESIEGSEIY